MNQCIVGLGGLLVLLHPHRPTTFRPTLTCLQRWIGYYYVIFIAVRQYKKIIHKGRDYHYHYQLPNGWVGTDHFGPLFFFFFFFLLVLLQGKQKCKWKWWVGAWGPGNPLAVDKMPLLATIQSFSCRCPSLLPSALHVFACFQVPPLIINNIIN